MMEERQGWKDGLGPGNWTVPLLKIWNLSYSQSLKVFKWEKFLPTKTAF